MNIWRLEYQDGMGLYHYDKIRDLRNILGSKNTHGDRWPMPEDDKKLLNNIADFAHEKFICIDLVVGFLEDSAFGFNSIAQMYHWFNQSSLLEQISEKGVMVAVYEVPESSVMIGDSQCCFEPCFHHQEYRTMCETIHEFLKNNPEPVNP